MSDNFMLEEDASQLMRRVEEQAQKVGLHAMGGMITPNAILAEASANDPTMMETATLRDVHGNVSFVVTFRVGNLAWSDRVQDPAKFVEREMFGGMTHGMGMTPEGWDDEGEEGTTSV